MNKKFSELKCGDSVFIWWLNKLYEYPFDHIEHTETLQFEGEYLFLKGGALYLLDACDLNVESFIYATDRWPEYKIFGTSKESVREILEKVLAEDKQKLENNTKTWLAEFDK